MNHAYIEWNPGELVRAVDGRLYVRRCEWFARCDNAATHLEPHPILDQVPACDRCPTIGR
jgi:hypothetical protein